MAQKWVLCVTIRREQCRGLAVPHSHPAAHMAALASAGLAPTLLHAHRFGSRIIILIWKQIFLSCVSQVGRGGVKLCCLS